MKQSVDELIARIDNFIRTEPSIHPDVVAELEIARTGLAAQQHRPAYGQPEPPAEPPPPIDRPGVSVAPEPSGHYSVKARGPGSEPGARTLQDLLNVMTGKPLGSVSQIMLELAARVEALELENAQLRSDLEAKA